MADIRFRLTNGQRQLIDRRRRGETQEQAAKRHGVDVKRYRQWELGKEKAPYVGIKILLPHERCYLLRLEAGLRQAQLADMLGCSRIWIHRMERGLSSPGRLVEYWNERV